MTGEDAALLERCMSVGGVAVFPADNVYGLACEPEDKEAVRRVYALKGLVPDRPAAIMFFDVSLALEAVPEVGPKTLEALGRILPGEVTVVLPNPAGRFPLACSGATGMLALRVPQLTGPLAPLADVRWPVLQTSATSNGGADATTVDQVPIGIREGCDLVLDGGELSGTPSTVVDLRSYEDGGAWTVIREGGMALERLEELL